MTANEYMPEASETVKAAELNETAEFERLIAEAESIRAQMEAARQAGDMETANYYKLQLEKLEPERLPDGERLSQESSELTKQLEPGVTLEHIGVTPETQEFGEKIEHVAGDPEADMENWHLQSGQYSCAICCQEFVAEQLLNQEFSEEAMSRLAEQFGWYDPEAGTPCQDVGKLLEAMGLEVERTVLFSIAELAEELESGGKPICAVNNMVLMNPEFADLPGYTANHVVEVIGIDARDPSDVRVILNDSGVQNGKGISISADTFMKAWNTSGNYTVIARKGAA